MILVDFMLHGTEKIPVKVVTENLFIGKIQLMRMISYYSKQKEKDIMSVVMWIFII